MAKQTNDNNSTVRIGRYVNVLKDRWFKRTFGWAPQKRLMQLLLQELIPERTISEISFGPQEHINPIELGKDIRLDVHCKDKDGNLFIVEVQISEQDTFYERAVYNSSFVIQEQLPAGSDKWDFAPIYFIGIVNFSIHKNTDQVLFRYRLKEIKSGEQMTDRIEYIFLELPNCSKANTPKATTLDNLCYVLGNISSMDSQPDWLDGEFYELLFNSTELSKFAPTERNEYIQDMTTERDRANQLATAARKGKIEAKIEVARKLLAKGMSVEDVIEATELERSAVLDLQPR